MSARSRDDEELLPQRERARVRHRDRKRRGPKVISVNPGLRRLALREAERLREQRKRTGS
jgi:hypothetical protein